MTLFIKNMVCDRCVMVVKQRLDALGIDYDHVGLGEVTVSKPLPEQQFGSLKQELLVFGFELLDDRKASLVNQVKTAIIQTVHVDNGADANKKLSVLLSEKLGVDYNYLSSLFSVIEGLTIEKYAILQRIEKVKELLAYNELSLNEIAEQLHYSSVQHLSQQFKKLTGLTPSKYKQSKEAGRKPLDQVGT